MAWRATYGFLTRADAAEAEGAEAIRQFSVELSASLRETPSEIELHWLPDSYATEYSVYRKALPDRSWSDLGKLPGQSTAFQDRNVNPRVGYEYKVVKTASDGFIGFGYIYAGINLPLVETRGRVILIVDRAHASDLALELVQFERDLAGDGWQVLRHDVTALSSVWGIKELIKADYAADPQRTRSVLLFGNVPVPYSGDITPDNHPESHQGAWPADVFYGDIDGIWTDTTVQNTTGERFENWNVPGDGKFDQSEPASEVELAVGRVDFSRMTCFSNKPEGRSERDLLRQYLIKNHQFRHAEGQLPRRGLIVDQLQFKGDDPVAGTAWRNFAPFFGTTSSSVLVQTQFYPTVNRSGFLWGYAAGGGSYYGCSAIGSADMVATNSINIAFLMTLGSHFGDWDNESSFLRALLGSSGRVLAVTWAGFPPWNFHPMALGETIGYCTRLTQNNRKGGLYPPYGPASGQVHISLLGDPTLRMHPVVPPAKLDGSRVAQGLELRWDASGDTNVVGYHVYRAPAPEGPFVRISGELPLPGKTFTDPGFSKEASYMVRAIKLEQSPSGTYFNASQGIFFSLVPWAPVGLGVQTVSGSQVGLRWRDEASNEQGFRIERRIATGSFEEIGTSKANETAFLDTSVTPGMAYFYRVSAYNSAGFSAYSETVGTATTLVRFEKMDAETKGSWKGNYGADGLNVIGLPPQYPAYADLKGTNFQSFVWSDLTYEPRALQNPTTRARVAACWFAPETFSITVRLTDQKAHRVALYFLDWDAQGREQQIDVLDAGSGELLDSQIISEFANGKYAIWELTGEVEFRLRKRRGPNVLLTGLFFDTRSATPLPLSLSNSAVRPVAVFVGVDTSTQGSWTDKFGGDGYEVIGGARQLPNFVQVESKFNEYYQWPATNDIRVLPKDRNSTERVPACWYAANSFVVDLNFLDGKTHRVAFYCLDYERLGAAETIEIVNTPAEERLDMQTLSEFQNGKYLIWDLRGHVKIRFSRRAVHAILMGLFVDPAPRELIAQPLRISLGAAGANLTLRLTGLSGQRFVLQRSSDLVNWEAVLTNTLSFSVFDFQDFLNIESGRQYYKALSLPDF